MRERDDVLHSPLDYIDPTTGGVLLQLLLAGSAVTVIVLRLFRQRIARLFRRSTTPRDR